MGGNTLQNIGPCKVVWYDVTGGTDLGKTQGDVTMSSVQESADMFNDQDGVSPVDGIVTGLTIGVVTPFSELTAALLQKLHAQATLTAITGQEGTLTVKGGVGTEKYAGANVLELTRYVNGVASADIDDKITILQAFPNPDFELVFGKETQRVVNVTWQCFPALETGDEGVYYRIGVP